MSDNKALADRLATIIGAMHNFADVADRCELTEGNAPAAIRTWADMLVEYQTALTSPQADRIDIPTRTEGDRISEQNEAFDIAEQMKAWQEADHG